MDGIDKWCAEQCGVTRYEPIANNGEQLYYWFYDDLNIESKWTIQDPRCREIVRERFNITTLTVNNRRDAWCEDGELYWSGQGKTIAEAEIACITAIYEARE